MAGPGRGGGGGVGFSAHAEAACIVDDLCMHIIVTFGYFSFYWAGVVDGSFAERKTKFDVWWAIGEAWCLNCIKGRFSSGWEGASAKKKKIVIIWWFNWDATMWVVQTLAYFIRFRASHRAPYTIALPPHTAKLHRTGAAARRYPTDSQLPETNVCIFHTPSTSGVGIVQLKTVQAVDYHVSRCITIITKWK